MRIAICEDETIFQAQLYKKLEAFYSGKLVEIFVFSSGEALLKSYEIEEYYDVIFLDIEMKQLNGIDTAKKIRRYGHEEVIIFLTSHSEYAIEGYEVQAMRFLLKPIADDKLKETLKEIKYTQERRKTILLHHSEGDAIINSEDILCLEAMRNDLYIKVGKHKGEAVETNVFKVRKTLSEMMEQLKSEIFFQCHRSYVVNTQWIMSFNAKEIKLEDGSLIPMSRGKAKQLNDYLMRNI